MQGQLLPEQSNWKLIRFDEDRDDFVKRPPYQRKNVWSTNKKSELIESFVRRLYVPPIVLRLVTHDTKNYYEVIDGQQRITAIQEYFNNEFALPDDSDDLYKFDEQNDTNFVGSRFEDLSEQEQRHLAQNCTITVDTLRGINDPTDQEHQELATQVFWRLQQGESLNKIEENHSKIYSPVRNYIVKRADDISFNMETYSSLDHNPDRHPFFTLLNYGNNRLKHLGLLARFLLVEIEEGPSKVTGYEVTKLFDCERGGFQKTEPQDSFENRSAVQRVDEMLDLLYEIYSEAELKTDDEEVVYFDTEYFIISLYTLVRELNFGNYRFTSHHHSDILDFTKSWYNRFENEPADDDAIVRFKANSQQNADAVSARHWIITNEFWKSDPGITEVDSQRTFTHAQRVAIFLRDDRICHECYQEELDKLDDGEDESVAKSRARVSWSNWDADHIVKHSEGGPTDIENGRVRCSEHNRADNSVTDY
jgi:hypothetical protein